MEQQKIKLHRFSIGNDDFIGISFPMDPQITDRLKQLNGRKWCSKNNWVYLKNTRENLKQVFDKFNGIAWIDGTSFFNKNTANHENNIILTISKIQYKIFIKLPEKAKHEWLYKIKSYRESYYINKLDLWALAGGNDNYLSIKKYFIDEGCKVIIRNPEKETISRKQKYHSWHFNKPIDENVLNEYRNTLTLRRVSDNTKKTYISMFRRFLAYFYGREISQITTQEIIAYMLWEIEENKISLTFQNQLINAIKYYFEKTLIQPKVVYSLPRAKREKLIPTVLNKNELKQMFSKISNLKHKCILSLLFSSGMRRNELINLKPQDIDLERKTVTIKKGKGAKGRISILSDLSIQYLHEYLEEYKPKEWLFVGQKGGRYSASSIWKIFEKIKKQYSISKKGSVHLLRHTFATCLLETGTDIRYIQGLLGHSSLKTTQIYTHIANDKLLSIKSPMDNLDLYHIPSNIVDIINIRT